MTTTKMSTSGNTGALDAISEKESVPKKRGLRNKDLHELFDQILSAQSMDLTSFLPLENGHGDLSLHHKKLLQNPHGQLVGVLPYELIGRPKFNFQKGTQAKDDSSDQNGLDNVDASMNVALKVKSDSMETVKILQKFISMVSQQAGELYNGLIYHPAAFVPNFHLTEVNIAKQAMIDPTFQRISPKVLFAGGGQKDDENYGFFVTEYVSTAKASFFSSYTTGEWGSSEIRDVLQDIAKFHAAHLGRPQDISQFYQLSLKDATQAYVDNATFLSLLCSANIEQNPKIFSPERADILRCISSNIGSIFLFLQNKDWQTIIHNDFVPKNMCLRKNPTADQAKLCVFDWELSVINVPQHDICQFLCHVLPTGSPLTVWVEYIEFYRQQLFAAVTNSALKQIDKTPSKYLFHKTFDFAMMSFLVGRISYINFPVSKVIDLPDFQKVTINALDYVRFVKRRYPFLERVPNGKKTSGDLGKCCG